MVLKKQLNRVSKIVFVLNTDQWLNDRFQWGFLIYVLWLVSSFCCLNNSVDSFKVKLAIQDYGHQVMWYRIYTDGLCGLKLNLIAGCTCNFKILLNVVDLWLFWTEFKTMGWTWKCCPEKPGNICMQDDYYGVIKRKYSVRR